MTLPAWPPLLAASPRAHCCCWAAAQQTRLTWRQRVQANSARSRRRSYSQVGEGVCNGEYRETACRLTVCSPCCRRTGKCADWTTQTCTRQSAPRYQQRMYQARCGLAVLLMCKLLCGSAAACGCGPGAVVAPPPGHQLPGCASARPAGPSAIQYACCFAVTNPTNRLAMSVALLCLLLCAPQVQVRRCGCAWPAATGRAFRHTVGLPRCCEKY